MVGRSSGELISQLGDWKVRLEAEPGESEPWRGGQWAAGDGLAGKQMTVQIDGGRTRRRGTWTAKAPRREELNEDGWVISDAPGRSQPRAERTFHAAWRHRERRATRHPPAVDRQWRLLKRSGRQSDVARPRPSDQRLLG